MPAHGRHFLIYGEVFLVGVFTSARPPTVMKTTVCLRLCRASMPASLQVFYACAFAELLCLRLRRASMPASLQGFYGSAESFLHAAHLCAVTYAFIGLLQRWTIPESGELNADLQEVKA